MLWSSHKPSAGQRIVATLVLGFFVWLMFKEIFPSTRSQIIRVNDFDQIEVRGKYDYIHRLVLTDKGPLRLPHANEWGRHETYETVLSQLRKGCEYEVMISHEPKDHEASAGNYRFVLRGNRELDVGRIDSVVRSINCL
jgi:hypothetical protein